MIYVSYGPFNCLQNYVPLKTNTGIVPLKTNTSIECCMPIVGVKISSNEHSGWKLADSGFMTQNKLTLFINVK